MNFIKFPLISPFKFVPATRTPGMHFDDSWACEQIKSWEIKTATYKQKWQRGDHTTLQIETTVLMDDMQVYNTAGQVVKTLAWQTVWADVGFTISELLFDIDDLPDGVYYLYQNVITAGITATWNIISEPIHLRNKWKNTLLLTYCHGFNDYGVAWSTGIKMDFRVEAALGEWQFERERTTNITQTNDIETLYGVAWRSAKLLVGDAPGVANWVGDLLNRIFLCNNVTIRRDQTEVGIQFEAADGAKLEITRVKGYPLIGCAIDVQPAFNNDSLEFQDATTIAAGIVTAYNIETAFFGPGALIPIRDVQKQG